VQDRAALEGHHDARELHFASFGDVELDAGCDVAGSMRWAGTTSPARPASPAADEIVMPRIEDKLVLVDLGAKAEDTVEVWIELRRRGGADVPVFLLAGVIERDF
jgi:hypothetical protein